MLGKTLSVSAAFLLGGGVTPLSAWGGSQLSMTGAIVATACDIDTVSRNQTIDMGTLPYNQIVDNSQGTTHSFSIRLVNCTLKHVDNNVLSGQHFRITFDGRNDGGRFGVEGEARGVAMVLSDAQGREAIPGEVMPLQAVKMQSREVRLHYAARMVSNNQPLQTGSYSALVRYHLDYY